METGAKDVLERVVGAEGLSPFRKRVLICCASVPRGQVTTYLAIAQALRSSSRAVGQALRSNPFAPAVPCHRVVRSDLSIGGFSGATDLASASIRKKIRMLREEGVSFDDGGRMGQACRASCVQRSLPDVLALDVGAAPARKRARSGPAAPVRGERPKRSRSRAVAV